MGAEELLAGWRLTQHEDGRIVVQHEDGSGVCVRDDQEESIAGVILHRLASDLIQRT
jgi:hypothetical protein